MNKQIASLVVALFAVAGINNAMAAGVAGGLSGQGEVTVSGGTISGSANSTTTGQAISGTEVSGNGYSNQATTSVGTGEAVAGGTITPTGIATTTSQVATSNVQSVSASNTPGVGGIVSSGAGDKATTTIENGTVGFSSVTNNAYSTGTFEEGGIGATLNISGEAGISGVGGL